MAATLQRKCSGGITFVTTTKIVAKIVIPRNYFEISSTRMALGGQQYQSSRTMAGKVLNGDWWQLVGAKSD